MVLPLSKFHSFHLSNLQLFVKKKHILFGYCFHNYIFSTLSESKNCKVFDNKKFTNLCDIIKLNIAPKFLSHLRHKDKQLLIFTYLRVSFIH